LVASGKAFVAMDRILDRAATGPRYLQQTEIAEVVGKALRDGEERFKRYELHAFVVIANHVHLLVTPNVVSSKWLGPLKGFTAREVNRILGLAGQHFWQDESYDHLVRSDGFERVRYYIQQNPVKVGVVSSPQDFHWSSAFEPAAAMIGCHTH